MYLSILDEVNTLLGLGNQVRQHGIQTLLLESRELAEGENLLNTVRTQANRGGEERSSGEVVLNEGALNDVLLATHGSKETAGEDLASVSHGQGGRTGTVLGLDDFVTTELDAVSEGIDVSIGELGARNLGQEGQDGGTSVTTDDSDLGVVHVELLVLRDEGVGTNDIQSGDTEEAARIVDTCVQPPLGNDRKDNGN